eukprot:scaffold63_cov306-Pinguiococcus_pyrenoidosus.AAC.49
MSTTAPGAWCMKQVSTASQTPALESAARSMVLRLTVRETDEAADAEELERGTDWTPTILDA